MSLSGTGRVGRRLGSGTNNTVYALAVSGSTLYAGGTFTAAGGGAANYVAQWDGSSWTALGAGMNDVIYALALSGSTLYAGGAFFSAGAKVSPYVVTSQSRAGALDLTDDPLQASVTPVRAVHITELRAYIDTLGAVQRAGIYVDGYDHRWKHADQSGAHQRAARGTERRVCGGGPNIAELHANHYRREHDHRSHRPQRDS